MFFWIKTLLNTEEFRKTKEKISNLSALGKY